MTSPPRLVRWGDRGRDQCRLPPPAVRLVEATASGVGRARRPRGESSDASPPINPKVILACARGTTTFYRVFYRVSWYGR